MNAIPTILINHINIFCSVSGVTQLPSELETYVEEELKRVQDELLSLEEVRSKVELEIQTAMLSGQSSFEN